MLKSLFNNKIRAGLANIDMKALEELPLEAKEVQLMISDNIAIEKMSDRLRIDFIRKLYFEPSSNFELTLGYFVEHFLTEENSLQDFTEDQIKEEVSKDENFYFQNDRGFAARISMLVSQITSTFGGPPVILPPVFPLKES